MADGGKVDSFKFAVCVDVITLSLRRRTRMSWGVGRVLDRRISVSWKGWEKKWWVYGYLLNAYLF